MSVVEAVLWGGFITCVFTMVILLVAVLLMQLAEIHIALPFVVVFLWVVTSAFLYLEGGL